MNENQEKVMSDFINWLPQNIGNYADQLPEEIVKPIMEAQNAETVVDILNQLASSEEGNQVVQSLFKAFESQTGLFREGGKLAYGLRKFQDGGPIDYSKFYKIIKAPGDTLMVKPYKYSVEERQTYPDGSVRYTTTTRSDTNTYWDPNRTSPNWLRGFLWGNRMAPEELLENWREIMNNHKNDTTNIVDKTKRK